MSSSTIEEIEGKRRDLFLSSAENALHDIKGKLQQQLDSERVPQLLQKLAYDRTNERHVQLRDRYHQKAISLVGQSHSRRHKPLARHTDFLRLSLTLDGSSVSIVTCHEMCAEYWRMPSSGSKATKSTPRSFSTTSGSTLERTASSPPSRRWPSQSSLIGSMVMEGAQSVFFVL